MFYILFHPIGYNRMPLTVILKLGIPVLPLKINDEFLIGKEIASKLITAEMRPGGETNNLLVPRQKL